MVGGYRKPPGDGLGPLIDKFDGQARRLRELELPTGTSIGSLVGQVLALYDQVQAALATITTTVTDAITALSYTQAQIDGKIASPGAISPTTVNTTSDVTVGGAFRAPNIPVTILTSSYFATYASTADGGRVGHVPSSAQFKQDMRPTTLDPALILDAEVVDFRYKAEFDRLGEDAPYIVGGIAEQFHDAGLGAFVTYDDEGAPYGIAYERLAIGILPLLQDMHARLVALEVP